LACVPDARRLPVSQSRIWRQRHRKMSGRRGGWEGEGAEVRGGAEVRSSRTEAGVRSGVEGRGDRQPPRPRSVARRTILYYPVWRGVCGQADGLRRSPLLDALATLTPSSDSGPTRQVAQLEQLSGGPQSKAGRLPSSEVGPLQYGLVTSARDDALLPTAWSRSSRQTRLLGPSLRCSPLGAASLVPRPPRREHRPGAASLIPRPPRRENWAGAAMPQRHRPRSFSPPASHAPL
jgi:hypothetical protein